MKKQTPMRFVDRYLTNLANIHEESGDTFRAEEVRRLHKQFEGLVEEEEALLKKAFVDGYETELNAHSSKSKTLSLIYFKENFQ
jgi:hypothetical protein